MIIGLEKAEDAVTVKGSRLHKLLKAKNWYDASGSVYDHRLEPYTYSIDLAVSQRPEGKIQLVSKAKFGHAPLVDPCIYGHVYATYSKAIGN